MTRLALALPLIMLAACDSSPDVKVDNAKPSEVAQEMKEAGASNFVRPGKWLISMTIEDVSMPGMQPQMAERMKASMAKGRQYESCLTPEEAKRPKGDFFAADKSCTYDHFEMSGGKIDATMHCTHEDMKQSISMQGSYSPDHYQMNMASEMSGAGPGGNMSIKMKMDSKRIGDCSAEEAKATG